MQWLERFGCFPVRFIGDGRIGMNAIAMAKRRSFGGRFQKGLAVRGEGKRGYGR
jgi:hypothetical protein